MRVIPEGYMCRTISGYVDFAPVKIIWLHPSMVTAISLRLVSIVRTEKIAHSILR